MRVETRLTFLGLGCSFCMVLLFRVAGFGCSALLGVVSFLERLLVVIPVGGGCGFLLRSSGFQTAAKPIVSSRVLRQLASFSISIVSLMTLFLKCSIGASVLVPSKFMLWCDSATCWANEDGCFSQRSDALLCGR